VRISEQSADNVRVAGGRRIRAASRRVEAAAIIPNPDVSMRNLVSRLERRGQVPGHGGCVKFLAGHGHAS